MPNRALALALAPLVWLVGAAPVAAVLPPVIPREVLFGNPERTSPALSPDGKRLAFVAPDERNILQVWVQTVGKADAKAVTADAKRGVRRFRWAEDNRTLLYEQDHNGDENFHLYGVDLATRNVRDYTPFQGVKASVVAMSAARPHELLVAMNLRNRTLMDVYRLRLDTGAVVLDTRNPGDVEEFVADAELRVRLARVTLSDGGTELRWRAGEAAPWKPLLKAGPEDELGVEHFSADGQELVLRSSIGTDRTQVVQRHLKTGVTRLVATSPTVDAGEIVSHPRTRRVEAVSFQPGRSLWTVLDAGVKADYAGIAKLQAGDFQVIDRDAADARWLVSFSSDAGPVRYYTWDRRARRGALLFSQQPKLEGLALAEMEPVSFKSRDGLTLHGYLSLPRGVEAQGLPLVVNVHGGPWARDVWGYDPVVQWLANRGYAVLQVNFRGSTGYGKRFLNAGNKQWGRKMHDDLIDAVNWATAKGLADPEKVAIFGGSYGGYATLAGLAFTPDVFACGVDIVGPANLRTLFETIPPYWKNFRAVLDMRVGNIDDPKDAALLKESSPVFKAHQIVRPLLIGQGANDPRVKQAESEQIVAAIEKSGGSVEYALYPDEGHGFGRSENRLDFYARAEKFLARHLGGRAEPMVGDRHPGSSAVVRVIHRD